MKILVFGKNSQICKELTSRINVVAIDREMIDFEKNIHDVKDLLLNLSPDVVINTVAYNNVDKAEFEESRAFKINSSSPAKIAKWCDELNITFVHFSTDYVFDGFKDTDYYENDMVNPLSVYGKSKLDGERNIINNSNNYIIIRTSWVFSPHNSNFVKAIIKNSIINKTLSVVTDEKGCPTSAYDLSSLIIKIIKKIKLKNFTPGLYHYSGTPSVSRYDFAKSILKLYHLKDYKINRAFSKDQNTTAIRPKKTELNCEKIKFTYGINQPFWLESLKKVLKNFNNEKKQI
jgi:dTDP-4-dehydrorhamnose reductase